MVNVQSLTMTGTRVYASGGAGGGAGAARGGARGDAAQADGAAAARAAHGRALEPVRPLARDARAPLRA